LRGVDIGTKRQFYKLLDGLASEGVAIVMLSTEIEELLLTCNRIAVCRSSAVSVVLSESDQTYDGVLAAMFGLPAHDIAQEHGVTQK
jgi:ribose transport system ATP-binding protein